MLYVYKDKPEILCSASPESFKAAKLFGVVL